jgi:hypothetical protein
MSSLGKWQLSGGDWVKAILTLIGIVALVVWIAASWGEDASPCSPGKEMTATSDRGAWASSKEAWNESIDAAVKGDKEGFGLQMAAGQLWALDPGTRVRVLGMGWKGDLEIRLLEGTRALELGYGDCDWLASPRSTAS